MALNSDDDDDWVLLRCTDPHQTDPTESDHTVILISTADISTWDFPTILTHQFVIVKSKRSRLIQHSSYFRGLLCGTFSDSCLNCISIKWNLETFMSILKIIFDFPVDVTSNNFLLLFEGALFFGVELLLLKCKAWLIDVTSSKDLCSLQIQLDDLINIWKFGIEHANDFIPELCTSYLARNFMWTIYCDSFLHIPCNLLVSCIKHPDLTVDSERHLADAFIVWLAANTEQFQSSSSTRDDCNGILKEIRISLLPLWFAAGKRRCCYFSKFANQSIEAILNLTAHSPTSMMNVLGDIGSHHLKIRLTQYTKKVDLSGCPQIKFAILLVSMLLCSHSTDPMLSKVIKQFSINLERLDKNQWQNAWALLPTLSFEVVEEVDISNCPGLYLEAAIECFCKSFPCLRVLKAAHSLNFRMMKLCQLVQKCPLLIEVDLTVDVSPVIPSQVSVVSSSPALTSRGSTVSLEVDAYPSGASQLYMSKSLLSNITKLTLEGRVDVSDYELKKISELCASLCYLNLRGCTSVTDAGISILVLRCIKLHSLVVCDTSFGQNSILALTSGIPNLNRFPTQQIEDNNAKSLAFKLQMLHMGGCNANWWIRFGSKTPELTKFAIRILSLTCSASGCERNWSTFESIHTKKRNRLEHKRLNALVYVKYNTKLRERSIRRRQNIDPILIDEIDSDDEWIAEKEDPVLSLDASWLDEEELFDAEAIRTVPITTYDRSVENRSTTTTINVDSSSNAKKRKVGEGSSVDETSLSKLMSETTMLKSLCLRETQIIDSTLYSFLGSLLEMLDVSDTKVSSAALAHIISRNPGLKCLKAKGCRNLFHQKSKTEGRVFSSFKYSRREWYIELGKTCKLEEIALGWGFSWFSLEALKPAITTLRAITVGLGASLGQDSLELLPTTCPLLETVILYFQVISDCVLINIMESLRHLQVLALCHCLGDISPVSFKYSMPNLRKLKLERVTPWMTNDDLVNLTQNCANLIELSLLGCKLLNSDSQQIISSGWPGLISIHLEDCGEVTRNGVASLFDCKAVEDIMLRHNGTGIQKNFILDAASMMPMLRKVSLDVCDASEGDFEIPNFADRYFLSIVKIARCKLQRCGLDLQKFCRTPVHKETLVLVWDSKNLTRTVIKERV